MGRIQGMNLHKMIWMEADLSWIFGESVMNNLILVTRQCYASLTVS